MGEERKLPFGITSVMPSTMQTLAESKVSGFTIGAQKRSNPFQKHKDEAEMKRRKESEEAAKAYEEFVASFEVIPKKEKSFVKGKSTFIPTSIFGEEEDPEEVAAKEQEAKSKAAYKPQAFVRASAQPPLPAKPALNLEPESAPYVKDAKAKRKRDMDALLEELKRDQEESNDKLLNRSSRDDFKVGSRDTGDPSTTNLYIGNINPNINEEQLCLEFGRYGPIASIKIMWPRTQEEIDRNRNCGFVSYMDRTDAAVALREMDGFDLAGYPMKLGWGKAVPLPDKPFFVHKDYKPAPKTAKVTVRKSIAPSSTDVTVVKPSDLQKLVYIHRVIERVLVDGPEFEEVLMERESKNPSFSFLVDRKSREHIYYRWKLYSMMQGDTITRWRTEPFRMIEYGPVWVPPLMSFTDEVLEEDERLLEAHEDEFEKAVSKGTLSRGARGFFEAQLRLLSSQRRSIGRAMLFCMNHADAADEIVEIIVNSMSITSTPQPARMARLYLISDILHNCGISLPNAWKFRTAFEPKLPMIFEVFNGIYRNIEARLKAEQFRRQISTVLAVWENWIVFPQEYIDNLANILVKRESGHPETSSTSSPNASADAIQESNAKSKFTNTFMPVDSVDESKTKGAAAAGGGGGREGSRDEDLDGMPLDEDLDGIPLNESIDGIPMDEDLDGVPL